MKDDLKDAIWVGFDLGGTKMMAAVYDSGFKEKGRERKKTKGQEGIKAGMARVIDTIKEALLNAKIDENLVAGIGLGAPGPLDLDKGTVIDATNLGWEDVRLKDAIEDEFHCPAAIANDVDAGLLGEYTYGAAKEARCVLGVFPGTGVGGGCIYKGQIIRGKTGSCMEIGHLPMIQRGALCGCGKRGCLETLTSRLAVSAAAAAAAYRGEAPHLLQAAGTDLMNIRSKLLVESIEAGDKAIEQIVKDSAWWLGRGIAIAVDMMAPDVVVVGGGMAEAMPAFYLEEVEASARQHVMPVFKNSFKVVKSRLGDDAVVLGAAVLASRAALASEEKNSDPYSIQAGNGGGKP